jgi:hypothetical protein
VEADAALALGCRLGTVLLALGGGAVLIVRLRALVSPDVPPMLRAYLATRLAPYAAEPRSSTRRGEVRS